MFRDQGCQQLRLFRFVEIAPTQETFTGSRTELLLSVDREEFLDNDPLLNGRLEFIVDDIEFVECAFDKIIREVATDIDGMLEA